VALSHCNILYQTLKQSDAKAKLKIRPLSVSVRRYLVLCFCKSWRSHWTIEEGVGMRV